MKRGSPVTRFNSTGLTRRGSTSLAQTDVGDEVVLLSTDSLFQEEKLDIFDEESASGTESTAGGQGSLGRLQRAPSLILNEHEAQQIRKARAQPSHLDSEPFASTAARRLKKFCEPNWFWIYNLRLAKYVRSFRSRSPQNRIDESKKLLYDFRDNVKPGLITAFINFPLVVAVAAGIGIPPSIGVRAALWSMLVTVLFGGCRFTVFGPTAVSLSFLNCPPKILRANPLRLFTAHADPYYSYGAHS